MLCQLQVLAIESADLALELQDELAVVIRADVRWSVRVLLLRLGLELTFEFEDFVLGGFELGEVCACEGLVGHVVIFGGRWDWCDC